MQVFHRNLFLLTGFLFTVVLAPAAISRSHAGDASKDEAEKLAPICGKLVAPPVGIGVRGDLLCAIVSTIDEASAQQFVSVLRKHRIRWIEFVSLGGDAGSALKIGEAVYDSQARLIVNGPCVSSCANYVFLAAREKYVLPGGVVAWHGGVPRTPLSESDPGAPLIARSNAFFAKIGVNRDLVDRPSDELMNSSEFIRARRAGNKPLWTYSRSDLETAFLVKGIKAYWYPNDAEWQKTFWSQFIFRTRIE
jgi:hypothetical protein